MKFLGPRYIKFLVYGLGAISLLTVFFGYKAMAAPDATSLTTSPVLLNLSVAPGSTTVQTVELMNNTTTPDPINMELMAFGAEGNAGNADITNIPASNPDSKYITFSPASFVAQPKVWSKVKVTIALPSSASLGYYYAIVFKPAYKIAPQHGKNIIEGSNAILALLNTNSANEQRSVQVASFTLNKKLYEYLPAKFSVNIRNTGNIYVAPRGDIFVSRAAYGGQSLASLPVNGPGGNVLPNSNRIFTASWSDGFPVYKPILKNGNTVSNNHGQQENNLKWDFSNINKLRFGRYYANLVMTYYNGSKTVILNGSLDFWVIPWEIILVLLVVLLIILLNLFLIGRSIYRRLQRGKSRKPRRFR